MESHIEVGGIYLPTLEIYRRMETLDAQINCRVEVPLSHS